MIKSVQRVSERGNIKGRENGREVDKERYEKKEREAVKREEDG